MSHAYSRLLCHVVFATKLRGRLIDDNLKPLLYDYIGGIVRTMGGTLYEINGMPDHVHLLIRLKPQTPITAALHQIKGASSRWLHTSFDNSQRGSFWQSGYGAFSVSESQMLAVARYIRNQEEHHRRYSFDEELKVLLKRHRVEMRPGREQSAQTAQEPQAAQEPQERQPQERQPQERQPQERQPQERQPQERQPQEPRVETLG